MKFSINNTDISGTNVNLSINFLNISLQEAVSIIYTINSKTTLTLSELDKELVNMINSGSLLQAVKHLKDKSGWGLKESKDYCDNLKAKYCKA